MRLSAWITSVYGSIIAIGGVIGYTKAGSTASLLIASIFALLLFSSAISMFRGWIIGQYTALIYSLLLDGFFTYRLLKTKAFMPSGMLCLLSVTMVVFFILQIRKKPKKAIERS